MFVLYESFQSKSWGKTETDQSLKYALTLFKTLTLNN